MDAATPDVSTDSGPIEPRDCTTAARQIAVLAAGPRCTSVVRVDYTSNALLGWQLRCGPAMSPTEADARKALAPYLPPYVDLDSYRLEPTPPPAPMVLFASPGDFGGVGLVSSRTGLPAFAGGIVWMGRGEIAWPTAWRDRSELSAGCTSPPPATWSQYVASGEMTSPAKAALDAVWATALPIGLRMSGAIDGAFVLGYPRTVGMLDPAAAEWIVTIESKLE